MQVFSLIEFLKVNSTEVVVRFLIFLANVRTMFRQVHLFAEGIPALQTVSTTVIPFKSEPTEYAEYGVTLSIALNAELSRPADEEKMAIGMSLLIRRSANVWIAEAEVGWTGKTIGWDPFASKDMRVSSIEEI